MTWVHLAPSLLGAPDPAVGPDAGQAWGGLPVWLVPVPAGEAPSSGLRVGEPPSEGALGREVGRHLSSAPRSRGHERFLPSGF